ncbi:hypothetical protein [Streptomyces abikoensis]|uniref:hypothetical protein n=1 Tax=Streptomyces abikoensis TaxID=97398 RepID=UPI001676262D|nr:hypothetical protein [Streptomyces abikoensis]GGP44889.1 hypothetical protein GCM10010214_17240 [Streptomyces abikoensis]
MAAAVARAEPTTLRGANGRSVCEEARLTPGAVGADRNRHPAIRYDVGKTVKRPEALVALRDSRR